MELHRHTGSVNRFRLKRVNNLWWSLFCDKITNYIDTRSVPNKHLLCLLVTGSPFNYCIMLPYVYLRRQVSICRTRAFPRQNRYNNARFATGVRFYKNDMHNLAPASPSPNLRAGRGRAITRIVSSPSACEICMRLFRPVNKSNIPCLIRGHSHGLGRYVIGVGLVV